MQLQPLALVSKVRYKTYLRCQAGELQPFVQGFGEVDICGVLDADFILVPEVAVVGSAYTCHKNISTGDVPPRWGL